MVLNKEIRESNEGLPAIDIAGARTLTVWMVGIRRWLTVQQVLSIAALIVLGVTMGALVWYGRRVSWTGLGEQTLWDWMELLILPIVLVAGVLYFNIQARKAEQELALQERGNALQIALDGQREDALQCYLDRISDMVLDKETRESNERLPAIDIAGARTLTVLRGLEGGRKGQVVRFLYESNLIRKRAGNDTGLAVIRLKGADLSGAILNGTDLSHADLNGANLNEANLSHADLSGADLSSADLSGADLSGANLKGANLSEANLSRADLWGAVLEGVDLRGGVLIGANLIGTDLRNGVLIGAVLIGADLSGAVLNGADLSDAMGTTTDQLAQSASLLGATLTNGTKVETEQDWDEFKGSGRAGSPPRVPSIPPNPQAITMKTGRPSTQDACPVCGTKVIRIGATRN